MDDQAALSARRPAVAFQEEPGGKRNGGRTVGGGGQGTSWVVRELEEGLSRASIKETATRRHNTRCEASQERVFALCCDKVKVEHLGKHTSGEG